jgi:hypothetical protein
MPVLISETWRSVRALSNETDLGCNQAAHADFGRINRFDLSLPLSQVRENKAGARRGAARASPQSSLLQGINSRWWLDYVAEQIERRSAQQLQPRQRASGI